MFKFALKILQHLLHLLLVFDLLLWILGVLELFNQRTLLSQITINHSINRNNSKITIITFNRNKPYRNFCGSPIWQSPDKSFSLTLDDSNNTKLSFFFHQMIYGAISVKKISPLLPDPNGFLFSLYTCYNTRWYITAMIFSRYIFRCDFHSQMWCVARFGTICTI